MTFEYTTTNIPATEGPYVLNYNVSICTGIDENLANSVLKSEMNRVVILAYSGDEIVGILTGVGPIDDTAPKLDFNFYSGYLHKYKLIERRAKAKGLTVYWIETICVDPRYRTVGIARTMISLFEQNAQPNSLIGIESIDSQIEEYYKKLGYTFSVSVDDVIYNFGVGYKEV